MPSALHARIALITALLVCRAPAALEGPPSRPYVLVLGTAQDGGIPHLGCRGDICRDARLDPRRKRLVTSLLLCDPRTGRRWLFDCSPDVEEQLARAQGHPATRIESGPRPPLFEGLFLTHAHMGHYGGLLELGREAYAASAVPTWVTPRFRHFLGENGPWRLLVEEQRLLLQELELDDSGAGLPIVLAPDFSVVPFRVPHRDEYSDTVGFEIRGPRRTLVYLPDIDKWEAWDAQAPVRTGKIEGVLSRCDVALLDGTFFADGEIPGRSMRDIPHPFIAESLARFAPLPGSERAKIYFTHLNHTNPAAQDESAAQRVIRTAGMHVLEDGQVIEL